MMVQQVTARKWRPETFEDVVGQRLVTQTLRNAIQTARVANAFVFSGIRGVGKTTTARILAKALNCRKSEGPTAEPCVMADEDCCDSCREIWESRSLDVHEMDAASHTSVDNVRENILAGLQYGAARDRFKIFIIDEVHMLSKHAFNALLKTLEEPPAHVKFILATTELQKIPATILSRCQQYDFKPIGFGEILKQLTSICRAEGIEISSWGLQAVAMTARGSMRDAQTTLDRVVALAGMKVSDEDVRILLGTIDEQALYDLFESVAEKRRKDLLTQLHQLIGSGIEPLDLCQKLMTHVANLMTLQVAGWDEGLLNLPESLEEPMSLQAEKFTQLDLIRFYDMLNRVCVEMKWHAQPHLHLEMALMKLVELSQLPTLEEVVGRLSGSKGRARLTGGSQPAALPKMNRAAAETSRASERPTSADPARNNGPAVSAGSEPVETSVGSSRAEDVHQAPEFSEVSAVGLVERLKVEISEHHPGFSASLQHASSIKFEAGNLSLVFPPSEVSAFKLAEQPEKIRVLQETVLGLAGISPQVRIHLGDEEEAEQAEKGDLAEQPEVKRFLASFPGKISVQRAFGEFEDHENEKASELDEAGSSHAGEA